MATKRGRETKPTAQGRRVRRARRRSRARSSSSTRRASTTSRARRTASPSRASRPRAPRSRGQGRRILDGVSALLVLLALSAGAMAAPAAPADLVLVGARIWTGDPKRPAGRRRSRSAAGASSRSAATPTSRRGRARRRSSSTAAGRRVVPGMIDCHTHMSMGGLDLLALDLRHTTDPAEFARMVAAYAAKQPAGVWLTDGAWDHEQWTPPRLPTKELLDPGDRRSPDLPLAAGRAHGRSATAWR